VVGGWVNRQDAKHAKGILDCRAAAPRENHVVTATKCLSYRQDDDCSRAGVPASAGSQQEPSGPQDPYFFTKPMRMGLKPLNHFRLKAALWQGEIFAYGQVKPGSLPMPRVIAAASRNGVAPPCGLLYRSPIMRHIYTAETAGSKAHRKRTGGRNALETAVPGWTFAIWVPRLGSCSCTLAVISAALVWPETPHSRPSLAFDKARDKAHDKVGGVVTVRSPALHVPLSPADYIESVLIPAKNLYDACVLYSGARPSRKTAPTPRE
jgi:hypothetical protein